MGQLEGVQITPLRIIDGPNGQVYHALKATDPSFAGFGEAYFSTVLPGARKGWKKHTRMVLNLVVISGEIRFVMYDDRAESPTYQQSQTVVLSLHNYQRLTVPPGIWMAFEGMAAGTNMLINLASIPHDPAEAENLPLDQTVFTIEY